MRLKKRIEKLERQLEALQQEICTHPAEELVTDTVYSDMLPDNIISYRVKCKKCGEILKRCASKEEILHEQIHILREQIANLPDEEDREE